MINLAKLDLDIESMQPSSAANLNGLDLTRVVRGLDLSHYVHMVMFAGADQSALSKLAFDPEGAVAEADDFLSTRESASQTRARMRRTRLHNASLLISSALELAEQHRILRETSDRIQEDLNAAALAQRQLLPEMHKDILGFHIASAFVPSAGVSGDMFGCFALPGNKLGIYAVDVAGHGINASLLSVAIGHLITPEFFGSIAFDASGTPDLAGLVQNLNRRFCSAYNDGYFTMFCAIIDKITGNMDMCQAGYPAPVYVAPDGSSRFIGSGGFPVGMFPDAKYENGKEIFEEGGLLVICSDAASEAEDSHERPFGALRLCDLVARLRETDVDSIPGNIDKALRDWRGGKTLEDDLTVLALKRTKTDD